MSQAEAPAVDEVAPAVAVAQPTSEEFDVLFENLKLDVAQRVAEKMEEVWHRGKRVVNQTQQQNAEKLEQLADQVSRCVEQQKMLEDENRELKQMLAKLTTQASMVGAVFGAIPQIIRTPKREANASPHSDCVPNGVKEPAFLSPSSSLTSGLAFVGNPLPDVPSFPFGTPNSPSGTGPLVSPKLVPTQSPVSDASLAAVSTPGRPALSGSAVGQSARGPTQLSLASTVPCTPSKTAASMAAGTQSPAGVLHSFVANSTFSFTLRKADNVELGLTVSHTDCNRYLLVECVQPDGAVEAWNRQSASLGKIVKRGDLILSVNGVSQDTGRMLEECKTKQLLKISICHAADELLMLSRQSSSLRADAAAFVPMRSDTSAASDGVTTAARGDSAAVAEGFVTVMDIPHKANGD
eukprot:TRINITY_DN75645_c0_g1_i1.p1 TRINITY_DN75645_c0_g1~~TRINITY_DN75645_c0_g1_i1.p1  ORF type:complete len:409 (-),score=77.29 TRINITY_DN75645_c0_g1_i1:159-1385(-)